MTNYMSPIEVVIYMHKSNHENANADDDICNPAQVKPSLSSVYEK